MVLYCDTRLFEGGLDFSMRTGNIGQLLDFLLEKDVDLFEYDLERVVHGNQAMYTLEGPLYSVDIDRIDHSIRSVYMTVRPSW